MHARGEVEAGCWCRNTSCKLKVLILLQSYKLFYFFPPAPISPHHTVCYWQCQVGPSAKILKDDVSLTLILSSLFSKKIFMVICVYFRMLIDRLFLKLCCTMMVGCNNVTRGSRAYNRSQQPGLTCCSSISSRGILELGSSLFCRKAGSELALTFRIILLTNN